MPSLPKVALTKKRKNNPEARMAIGDHLRELRNRAFISAIAVLICSVVGYFLSDWAYTVITQPIVEANKHGRNLVMNFETVMSSFDLKLRLSIWLGVLLSAPIWTYEFWAFVAPGMTSKEKRFVWGYGIAALLLFTAGVALGIYIIPHAVIVLTSFMPDADAVAGVMSVSTYLSFVMRIVLAFGAAFLLPEIMVGLNQLGLMKGRTMLKGWRWAVVAIVIFMAIVNPLPDPWSVIFMSIPITGLYFGACGISIQHDKRLAKRLAAEDAALEAALAE
ncbi:Sec-independent protein translocase protein TatCy [Actinomyces bovis]|uniref:Sec-independent protein translocase protein TatC n=1 Tax=Actinomyces bovis TaxID=1658 RepID=A0ABY1VPF7_9ACTO|nr:twin-arginine translocase subunit TatC [Actinomyces bovis]SPT54016.1 Sec-independent protein translocase protein TatCy [Actinomyces bovis]VEG53850.1 Sec-independent protein translocase protein TatCy [Actinomyces israelii]